MTQRKDLEKQFFNRFALVNSDYDVFDEQGYKTLIDEFCLWLQPKQGEMLLDLGGGTGAFSRRLLNLGLNICVIDLSIKCLAIAAKIGNNHFKQSVADIEQLPFEDSSVDIVCFSGVLHHFTDFNRALKEGYRVLKPGGRLFAYDPHQKNPFMWLYRSPGSPVHSNKGRTHNERLLAEDEIRQGLNDAGFIDILVKAVSGVSFKYVESRLVRTILSIYNLQENLFKGTSLASKYGSFILTYAKKQVEI